MKSAYFHGLQGTQTGAHGLDRVRNCSGSSGAIAREMDRTLPDSRLRGAEGFMDVLAHGCYPKQGGKNVKLHEPVSFMPGSVGGRVFCLQGHCRLQQVSLPVQGTPCPRKPTGSTQEVNRKSIPGESIRGIRSGRRARITQKFRQDIPRNANGKR